MRRNEMNAHQKAIFDIMTEVCSEYIGGYENTLSDFDEDDEEYVEAKNFLEMGHDKLKDFIYNEVMKECKAGSNASHARFAGKDFLMERIEARLLKWNY